MARLQWDQIAPPQFGDAARILESSLSSFAAGANGISDTLTGIRNRQKNNRSSAAFDVLAGVKSEKDVSGALARVAEMVAPQDRTPELMEAMMNLQQNGMAFDTNRLNQENTRLDMSLARNRDARDGESHNWDMQGRREAGQVAAALARDAQGQYGSGGGARSAGAGGGGPLNDREILARTIQAEAGGEGYDGMLGVGAVIANRVSTGKYGDGLRGVIMKPGQFSAWNGETGYAGGEGALDMRNMQPSQDAYAVADQILSGEYQDPTGGATHYYNDQVATPKWGMEAGGDWGRIGNHVFGNPDGIVATGPSPRFLEAAANSSTLSPEDILSWTKSYDELGTIRERASDENRQRDSEFAATERNRIQMEQAAALIEQAARQASTPEEIPAIVAQSGAPAQVQALALNEANSPYVAAQFARPYDPNESGLPGSGDAIQQLDITDAMINDVKNTDPTIRIQANAAEYSSDPGVMLAEKLGDTTDDGKGRALDAITTVVRELKAEGVSVSPAEAASLLYENAYTAGWTALAPTGDKWGKVYGDTDAAVAMGKTYLATERKRAGMELVTDIARAESASKANREALAKVDEAIKVQENRRNFTKVDELMAERAEIIDRMVNMEDSLTFLPKSETPANAGATNTTPAPTNNAPATTAEQAMQQAEMQIAATAIVEGTGGVITLERLAQEPPEMQLQILETVQRTLEQNGDSGAKIQVIEAMKQDIISQMSR